MALFALTRNRVNGNCDRLIVALRKFVHAYHDALMGIGLLLVAIRGIGNFTLWKAAFDGCQHSAHLVDPREIFESAALHAVRESFNRVGPSERVDGVGDATFVRDDLLRS